MPRLSSTKNVASNRVSFFTEGVSLSLKNRTQLKLFLVAIFKEEGVALDSLNFIFGSDEAVLAINRQFLSHDFYTDIITFDLSTDAATLGEIYISVDRVRDNASTLHIPFQHELHRVIFHGVLHLCGYGDKTKGQVKLMREKENHYLLKYLKG